MRVIRAVVADDDTAVRAALRDVLEDDPRFEVVGTAATGADAVAVAEAQSPDIVLLDVRMPGGGVEAARDLAAGTARPRVLAVSASTDPATVLAMLRAGAAGYLAKGRIGRELPDLVARCFDGELLLEVPRGDAVRRALLDVQPDRGPASLPGS